MPADSLHLDTRRFVSLAGAAPLPPGQTEAAQVLRDRDGLAVGIKEGDFLEKKGITSGITSGEVGEFLKGLSHSDVSEDASTSASQAEQIFKLPTSNYYPPTRPPGISDETWEKMQEEAMSITPEMWDDMHVFSSVPGNLKPLKLAPAKPAGRPTKFKARNTRDPRELEESSKSRKTN